MIRCGHCNKPTTPGVPTHEVIIEQRDATFAERWTDDRYEPKCLDAGGEGRQIVKTKRVGECCIAKLQDAE